MVELPWRCRQCSYEQMVDMENLTSWPLDRIITVKGYVCERCRSREAISYTNSSLDEALRKLTRISPQHRNFSYYFAKALLKAEKVNRRRMNGSIQHKNVVAS